jgi:adenylate cyclase
MSLLFADIRGSTGLAEAMSPSAFRLLMDRFYSTASQVVFEHEGFVDKFVGDELVALFAPLFCGDQHALQAVHAARALLLATGHGAPGGPWVPVGAGITSGVVWFGAVGEGGHVELTALGDEVNVAARLASAAGAGEILVTAGAAEAVAAAGDGLQGGDRRELALKGKAGITEVLALRVDTA